MCLYVENSYVKQPIAVMRCVKSLIYSSYFSAMIPSGFFTPYYKRYVPIDNGWFDVKQPCKRNKIEFSKTEVVFGGYLHAHTHMLMGGTPAKKLPRDLIDNKYYYFEAYAFDVVAIGDDDDLVCKKLYIPAFDETPEVSQQYIKSLRLVLPTRFGVPSE